MTDFRLKILQPGRTEVLLDSPAQTIPWAVVTSLDRAGIRVVAAPVAGPRTEADLTSIAAGCSGVITVDPTRITSITRQLPYLNLAAACDTCLGHFVTTVQCEASMTRPYAFFVGRLERDFDHARAAIRAATERAAGLPLLWADDGRHVTNVESIREATRLTIRHAAFVVADLTLGVENPRAENPSRAHEIGLTIAYERPLLLTSQEPRRYPYFSISDRQMLFWLDEDELAKKVETWIATTRAIAPRRILNYELPEAVVKQPSFVYDAALRYVGPRTPRFAPLRRVLRSWRKSGP
jgi:hypothetical protein